MHLSAFRNLLRMWTCPLCSDVVLISHVSLFSQKYMKWLCAAFPQPKGSAAPLVPSCGQCQDWEGREDRLLCPELSGERRQSLGRKEEWGEGIPGWPWGKAEGQKRHKTDQKVCHETSSLYWLTYCGKELIKEDYVGPKLLTLGQEPKSKLYKATVECQPNCP